MAGVTDAHRIQAAKTGHEITLALKLFHGEEAMPVWDKLPAETKHRNIIGVNAVIDKPDITPAEIHQVWVETMLKEGWRVGPKYDTIKKAHPSLVPYMELEDNQKLKDVLYLAAVKSILPLEYNVSPEQRQAEQQTPFPAPSPVNRQGASLDEE